MWPCGSRRDISHSGAERVVLADSFTALDYMFGKMQWMLDGLQTYPAKMEHNLWRTKGLIFSSKVLLALVDAASPARTPTLSCSATP